ncbi:hypothetical protein [Cupriavidus sp. USMAA2-4]|uniref:hypothetical protein n=1 Tax=Cupriavidus sp. USMAA2-4 TaxID=876364 RepID=UPI0012F4F101|nr:hypothetical protein [Cupriavidus sp. USMAA2-4]
MANITLTTYRGIQVILEQKPGEDFCTGWIRYRDSRNGHPVSKPIQNDNGSSHFMSADDVVAAGRTLINTLFPAPE